MSKLLVTFIIAVALSGCTLFSPVQQKISEKGAEYIVKYCDNTDENYRAKLRADVAGDLPPGYSAEITCPE